MFVNPYEKSAGTISTGHRKTVLNWFVTRLVGVPICGVFAGAISGACMGPIMALVELTPAPFIEWVLSALYLAVIGGIYGIQAGLIASAFSVPMQFVARKRRFLDGAVVLLVSALLAWWWYYLAEHDSNWEPRTAFLLPRIVTSAITCYVSVWFFGRDQCSCKPEDDDALERLPS